MKKRKLTDMLMSVTMVLLLLSGCEKENGDEIKEFLVPENFTTIQSAIDASSDGDVIIVSPGTYKENISFKGKNITLKSSEPENPQIVATTIIDGDGKGRTVMFGEGESDQALLWGFTITGGAAGSNNDGGGIYIHNQSNPVIRNNHITGNSARYGAGVAVTGQSEPLFDTNLFTLNNALSGRGAAIYIINQSNPEVSGNIFTQHTNADGVIRVGGNNQSQHAAAVITGNTINNNISEFGSGGIDVTLGSTAMITNNIITNNKGSGDNAGGAITISFASTAEIRQNTLTGNQGSRCGAVVIYRESEAVIDANTLADNQAGNEDDHGVGGAILLTYFGSATITNNTITGNKAWHHSRGGGGIAVYSWGQETHAVISNNVLDNNRANRHGGGIYLTGTQTTAVISNNTLKNNQAAGHFQACGGAVYCGDIKEAKIHDNTFENNLAQWYGGGIYVHRNGLLKDATENNWPKTNSPPASETNNTYSGNDHGDDTHMGADVFFDE